ncbi:MAG: replication associated protein [Lactobacillus sp.]|jgi:mRNA-degrading endonuclease YafQ of YafQ-DinJ toxin-antitoxin module|nr:replication associated protein [Lactobacillus sp.]MCH3906361.1 replication associated protein [Lactobacillus sp.]MCH3990065.1 replication associated protein [Lactobacillus sp.]MCH4069221.1 replication associated protein [Lactobacillus sp.]MCI1303523.1 replication associated protein [Lactobacillus sp.]
MSKVIPTNHFKKQYKKVKKDSRWLPIFKGTVPFDDKRRSPWEYIIECFLEDKEIPKCFYEHPITLIKLQKQEIKRRLGTSIDIQIRGLDLHLDGHNGDHLLLYIKTNKGVLYLTGIGTHSELF